MIRKNMMNRYVSIMIILFFITACKKDDSNTTNSLPDNPFPFTNWVKVNGATTLAFYGDYGYFTNPNAYNMLNNQKGVAVSQFSYKVYNKDSIYIYVNSRTFNGSGIDPVKQIIANADFISSCKFKISGDTLFVNDYGSHYSKSAIKSN